MTSTLIDMKIIKNFNFLENNIKVELNKIYEDNKIINYEQFILENPITKNTFPEFDEPYYTHLEYSLRHLLYKFDKNWITSSRQVIMATEECISTIHFVYDNNKKVTNINVFQRSSNINNIEEDMQFLNYFKEKYLTLDVNINVFVSMPHIFLDRITKVDK